MPEPIIEPTTIARLIHLPSIRELGSGCVSITIGGPDIGAASHRGRPLAMRTPAPNRPATAGEFNARIPFSGAGQPGRGHGQRAGTGEPDRPRRVRRGRPGARPEPD